MKNYFPQLEKKYLQTNRSNILGNMWSSKGLDFQTNWGAMRLADKLVINTDSVTQTNLGRPAAFEHFDDRLWAIAGTRVFKTTNNRMTSVFSEDASTGAITTYDPDNSDLCVFQSKLWSSSPNKLLSKAANSLGTGSWTDRTGGSSMSGCGKLVYFKKFDRLYFVNTSTKIGSVDTSNTVATSGDYTLNLGDSIGVITTIVTTSNKIWIGTLRISNSAEGSRYYGSIVEWDGISAQVSNEYVLKAAGVMAMAVDQDLLYAVDSEGRVLQYTGSGFEEIERLPIERILLTGASNDGTTNGRFLHMNGLQTTKNHTLLMLINNLNVDNTGSINENLTSGIWEMDLDQKSLTNRYCFTYSSLGSSTITDYGQNRILGAGALKLNTLENASGSGRCSLICGSSYYTNATNTKSAIFVDSPVASSTDTEGQKRGYFVTTWIESQEIQDNWVRLWTVYRRFTNTSDSMVFKYRLSEESPIEATITWTSTTTFTTTTNITAYGPTASPFNGTVGGEVEIIQGTGAGACAHITSITGPVTGTYTVTIDTVLTGVTGTAKVRLQKWIKLTPEITGLVKSFGQMSISGKDTRVQIKGCLNWTGNGEFYKMVVFSNEDIKITA